MGSIIGQRRMLMASLVLLGAAGGCAPEPKPAPWPSIAPTTQPGVTLALNAGDVRPMYRELLAVDLPTVKRVALAQSMEVREAQQRVEASRGRYETSVETVLPVIAPSLTLTHLEGVNQNANGSLTLANFNNFLPALTVQWIINPGQVVYDIIASKRRLEAAGQEEEAVRQEALRLSAVEYYDLVLAQARVAAARQAVTDAEEALRLTDLRVRTGTALAADGMRAKSFLAGRNQDLLLAVNAFYMASLELARTLQLDPVVTLVPKAGDVAQATLVREDLSIEELLGMAVQYRPDLEAARTLLKAADADKGSVIWGALGPQLQAAYTVGGIKTQTSGQTSGLHEQQKATAGAGFNLGASTFGRVKTASASVKTAALEAERQLEQVRIEVVRAQQSSITSAGLIPIAHEQVESAEEALRLTQANLRAGTMLLLDVLQSQDEVTSARVHYADAVAHYNQAQVNLVAALGLLGETNGVAATRPATAQ